MVEEQAKGPRLFRQQNLFLLYLMGIYPGGLQIKDAAVFSSIQSVGAEVSAVDEIEI